MPVSAPASYETRSRCRGRPSRKAAAQAVCHCHERKTEGCRALASSEFQRPSSSPSKPGSDSTFIVAPALGQACLAGAPEVASVPAIVRGRFVHGRVEVVAQVLAHFFSHALDEARDAARVVLVEVSEL